MSGNICDASRPAVSRWFILLLVPQLHEIHPDSAVIRLTSSTIISEMAPLLPAKPLKHPHATLLAHAMMSSGCSD
jgi:hypothetical protein